MHRSTWRSFGLKLLQLGARPPRLPEVPGEERLDTGKQNNSAIAPRSQRLGGAGMARGGAGTQEGLVPRSLLSPAQHWQTYALTKASHHTPAAPLQAAVKGYPRRLGVHSYSLRIHPPLYLRVAGLRARSGGRLGSLSTLLRLAPAALRPPHSKLSHGAFQDA